MKKFNLLIAALFAIVVESYCGVHDVSGMVTSTPLRVENPTAQDFMQRSYSNFVAGEPSFLDDPTFRNLRSTALGNGYRNDQPQTYVLKFPQGTVGNVHVVLSRHCDLSQPELDEEVYVNAEDAKYELRNFVPGNTYFYKVTAGSTTLASGAIVVSGQLRMIHLNSGWNIRDLGGWKGWGGNTVRYEQIYRGGSLGGQNRNKNTYLLPKDDLAELHRIGIRAQLDLRAQPSKGAWPTDDKLNAYTLGYSTLAEATFLNNATDYALYHAQGSSAAVGDVAWVIRQLHEGRPVYFHCRTGADRTGVVGYSLLGLLGCDAYTTLAGGNQLALDYELTSLGMDEEGTIEYNTTGQHSGYYSNRYANQIATMGYDYFRTIRSLESPKGVPALRSFMEQCYYYLNRYFRDNDVPEAGRVFINKSDLDWFVNFMLGITDREGNLLPGHKKKFVGPSWAVEDENNTLEAAYTTAHEQQYEYAK